MKKFMKKCKKALVIAMTIMLVGTSIDTSTLYVRAENTTDVTDEISEQQTQLDESEENDELQNQPGESEGSDEQQIQPVEKEGSVESFNQPGETEVDYEELSSLEEGSDEQQGQSDEEVDSDETQDQADDDADNSDAQNQPTEGEIIFIDELIIELPEPGTSVPAMGFFSLADGNVTLAAGNHVEYIDRIDLSGDAEIFKTLYANMEEWSDNDGTDDWMIAGEKDQYLVATVSGKAIAAEGQTIDDAVEEEAYVVFDNYSQYIWAVANAFDRDHPEVFWLGGTPVSVGWSYSPTTGDYNVSIYVVFHKVKQDGSVSDIRAVRYRDVTTLKAAIDTMNTNASAILAGAEGLDIVGKIKYFNEKLTKSNEYNTIVSSGLDDSNVNRDTWECVSALAGKTGEVGPVCEAYARAFKVLCDRSGIPCVLEDGIAGGPHMWNAVQVNEIWYATDVTWNDPTGGASGAISGYENENWLLLGTNTIPAGETKTFSESHVTQNSPSGTLQYTNGPVLSTEKYSEYEASVTTSAGVETKYETFSDAFSAVYKAGPGATLKLLKSVEETNSLFTIGSTYTLDLNGHELKVMKIYIREGNITIIDSSSQKNGKLYGSGKSTIEVSEEGVLTVIDTTIINTEGYFGGICNKGTVNIIGGRIEGTRCAIDNTGSMNISGDPTIVGGGSAPAIFQTGENLLLSGGAIITGGEDTEEDIRLRPYEDADGNKVYSKVQLVGALTNTTPYSVIHEDSDGIYTGVFAVGGTNPNDMTAIVYNITTADAAKFVAADTSLLVKQDTTNNQLLLERKPHVHDLYLSNSVNGVASAQTVEILCTNSEDAACELNSNSYYVTVKAPTSLEYDTFAKNATVVDNISYNDVEATVSTVAYYVKNGSTWTSVAEVVNVGTYKAEVTVTMGSSSKKAAVEFTIAEMSSEGFVEVIPYSGVYDPFAPQGVEAIEVDLLHPDLEDTATIQYSTDGGNTWSTTVPKIKNAGSLSVTVKVTSSNFTEYETTVQATVKPYDISNCSIELEQDTYYYTGKEAKPVATGLTDGSGQRLPINAADIVVSYEDNIAVGAATVSVSVDSSNYTGTTKRNFSIEYFYDDITILYNGSEDHEAWFAEDVVITAEGYSVKFAEDDTFSDSVTVSGEGEIEVELVFKQDDTGYITAAWHGSVRMDKTGPIFTKEGDGLILIIPSEPSNKKITWKQLATEITYDIYGNAYTYARIYASDKYASVDGLYYYLDTTGSETVLTKAQLDTLREAGKFEQLPYGVFDFYLEQDGKYVIYAYATDDLGNVSEYISSNGIVIDTKAPVVEVVEPTKEAGTLKDTEMTFKVKADEDVMIGVYLTTDYSGESQNMKISDDEYGYWESIPADEQTVKHEDGKTYISYKVFAEANETKTITITGLKPNTYYEYSVEVYDLAQNGTVAAGKEDEIEPGMYRLKEITTLKTALTFDENPTITGTYGDKLSEMTVSQPGNTDGVPGTWSIVYAGAGQRNDMPAVGGTTAYDVKFTPEDADTYETVTVKVVPDVAKMPLTVKIDNQTRVYGEENPELTYTITEGSIVDSNYAGRPRLGIELSTEAMKTSDVGTYEIIATVTNDDNYAVTVQAGTLTITQADAVITVETGKDAYNKTFGDDDFSLSGISTNSDGNISYGVIGESVAVMSNGNVLIRGAGSSTVTVHVPATKNYKASEAVEITITVAKADIDAVNISKNYLYVNDAQDTIDLSAYVPADAGNATYSVGVASGECEFAVAPAVDANGKLSYIVKAGEAGDSAFFMATVNSDNYKSLVIKVNVTLVDKTPVAEKTGSEVSLKNNTLTYGEALSKLEFNEAVFVANGTGEVVSGTLAWETPDYKPNVETTKATWVFTPDDDKYMSATGELAIVVEKAEQPTLSIEDLGNVEYAPNKELTIITTGGIPDGELTISVPANNGVIELSADGKAKVIGAGTVIITAVNVDPEGNYEDATANYELIVAKAQQPEFSIVPVTDAAYGMEGSVWLETTGGLDGAEITFTVPENNGVVTAVNVSGAGKSFIVPLSSGKVVVTAVAVDPEGNYEDAVATYELTVAPASIKADWISWLDGFTGVGTYNGSAIAPGVMVYFIAEGNLTEGEDYTVSYVNNTYAYTLKEGDEGFDATKAPAVVVTGKGNYTGSATVYFVINKAEAAPNMPADSKTVANHIATAGQVSLPTDWIWQDSSAALTEGGETIAVAVYNGADKGNYVKETVYVTITRMEAGAPYVSKINGQDVAVIEKGWQKVSDVLNAAAEGDVITVEMNGVTVLPGNVISNIKGKNITVELNMGNGVIWTINGKNITASTVADVDMKVDLNTTNIPVEVINKITGEISTMQISLAHDGDFGYKAFMRINLDAANAGYYAQLFHYEESAKALKYVNQSKIDATGIVELPFTHASEYTIVIDDAAYQVPGSGGNGGGSNAPAATPTPTPAPTQAPPVTKLPNTADEFPLEGILLLMMVCMAAFGGTVAYGKCKKAGRK